MSDDVPDDLRVAYDAVQHDMQMVVRDDVLAVQFASADVAVFSVAIDVEGEPPELRMSTTFLWADDADSIIADYEEYDDTRTG